MACIEGVARVGWALVESRSRLYRARLINGGAIFIAVVLVVVLITKFHMVLYLVVISMPALFLLIKPSNGTIRSRGRGAGSGPGGTLDAIADPGGRPCLAS